MSTDTVFQTKVIVVEAGHQRPIPTTNSERYLIGLLDSQEALRVARDALTARMAYADAGETDDIRLSMAEINADYLKLAAMKTAFLSRGAQYTSIGVAQLVSIRNILNQLQGFTAKKEKASAIVDAVTMLLANWKRGGPVPDEPVDDPVDALAEKIKV